MTRTLRHEASIPREIDGAVKFDDLIEKLKVWSLLILCSGQPVLGWILWQKEEERRRGFNTAWILIHPMKSCTSEQFKAIQIARQYIVAGWLCRVHLPHRERLRDAFHYSKWTDPRWKKQQKGQTVSVLHGSEPDGHSTWSKRSWIRYAQTQNRTVQTHLEISSQYSILVQFNACSDKGIALLSNSVACNYSFRHTTSDLYLHENKGRTLLHNFQVSQVTSRSTCAELATRSEGCTCFRFEKIRWPWEWSSSAQENLWQWPLCWFSNSWHSAVEQVEKSKRKSSTNNWAIRKSPKQEHVAEGLQEIRGDEPLQSRIKGFDYCNGPTLRVLRDFFQETISRLRHQLGNWYRILHMRKMHAAIGKKSTVEQRQIWLIVDSWMHDKEEPIPRSYAWSINASNNVSQSTWYVEESQSSKECETILGSCFTDAVYQKSLSDEGWTEEKIRQYDALVLEDHSYEATRAERARWQRNWKIVFEHKRRRR